MSDQAVNEMMSAFAVGCMDKENYTNFKKHIESKSDLPYGELGRLQAIVTMLPFVLEQEQPPAHLKNHVGRRLMAIQDEMKEKLKSGKTLIIDTNQKRLTKTKTSATNDSFAQLAAANETPAAAPRELHVEKLTFNENKITSETMAHHSESSTLSVLWIVVIILILMVLGLAYYGYNRYYELKEEIGKLDNSLTSTKTELRSTNEFITKNAALIEFFNYDNVWVVPLSGTDPSSKVSGKLYVALTEKEALIQVDNLPNITPDKTFQVWIVSKNQTYSMGKFFIEPGSKYVKLTNIPGIPKEQILQFKITEEPRDGSVVPSGQIYAVGLAKSSGNKTMKKY